MEGKRVPLAEMEDIQALKEQYQIFTDRVLLKWMEAVTGSHREAITALLRERGYSVCRA